MYNKSKLILSRHHLTVCSTLRELAVPELYIWVFLTPLLRPCFVYSMQINVKASFFSVFDKHKNEFKFNCYSCLICFKWVFYKIKWGFVKKNTRNKKVFKLSVKWEDIINSRGSYSKKCKLAAMCIHVCVVRNKFNSPF